MFWAFEKGIFQFFAKFEWRNWNYFLGKWCKVLQSCLNQKLIIRSFLENCFGATLSSKTSVVSVWKSHFSFFWKFLSNKVETVFWESEAKRSKLFKSNFGHRNLLRKWFWSYLELKNECSQYLKRAFLIFLEIFEWQS